MTDLEMLNDRIVTTAQYLETAIEEGNEAEEYELEDELSNLIERLDNLLLAG